MPDPVLQTTTKPRSVNELHPDAGAVLLSGASGMMGHAIARLLTHEKYSLLKLVRRAAGESEMHWNPVPGGGIDDPQRLEGIQAAIHLSGANVAAHRWSAAWKREMAESRLQSTQILSQALARLKSPPAVLVAASAIGFYGDRGEEILEEDSQPGTGLLPDLCSRWEAATHPARQAGIRVVHLRLGIVLGAKGGALPRMLPLFRLGLGGPLGSGRQWMSWIAEADAAAAFLFALRNPALRGPVNAVAPQPVTNAEFTRQLARAVHRPAFMKAPAFALRLAFGQMADEALLASAHVLPQRLTDAGFSFTHPTLAAALAAATTVQR